MKKRALFYGTEPALYHPMRDVGERIKELLPEMEIRMSSQEEALQALRTERYDICFLYTDFEQPPIRAESAAALLSFTAGGGGIFALHGGIALQNRPEIGQLLGGTFTGHPPYETLPTVHYEMADKEHPLVRDVEDFAIPDELYLFYLPPLEGRRIFLTYEEKGVAYPAGWTREYGLGRVIYLCCGHNADAFENEMLAGLLRNGTEWLINQ